MRHTPTRVTFLAVALTVFAAAEAVDPSGPALQPVGWQVVGQPGFSEKDILCPQILIDRDGRAFVSYKDDGPASVVTWAGQEWKLVGQRGTGSKLSAWYNNMAVDDAGMLYLFFREYNLKGDGHVKRISTSRPDARWEDVGEMMNPAGTHWTQIAVDRTGVPYVAYADRTKKAGQTTRPTADDDRITVRRFRDGRWQDVGHAGFSPAGARFTSIAVDAAGVPWVVFADRAAGERATVMRFDERAAEWKTVGPGGFTNTLVGNTIIRTDRKGVMHVAGLSHNRLAVYRFDGTGWSAVGGGNAAGPQDFPQLGGEGWRQWLSLAFDSKNRPWVCYGLMKDKSRLAVRRLDGDTWNYVGDRSFTPDGGLYPVMALDPQDRPWVAFKDVAHGGRLTVMRYAP